MKIYCIGEMVIDFIPGEQPGEYIRNAGGAPANVAIAAARNGISSGMCCKLGDDDFGKFLAETLYNEKVELLCKDFCEEAVTTMAFVSLQKDGERTFTFARKPGADMFLKTSDVKEQEIDEAVIVHAGSCSLSAQPVAAATEKALVYAHMKNKIVSFDINYRNLMWKDDKKACTDAVEELLPYIDILKISEEELDMVGGQEEIQNTIKKNDLTAVVLTLGSDGAKVFFHDQVFVVPGHKVKAVDATGAGDAFWGGFLSSLLIQGVEKKEDITEAVLKKALEYGNISGAICVQKKGAITSLPTREQIEEKLKECEEE